MADSAAKKAWDAANTTRTSLKLNRNTDADIVAALEGAESRAGRIKELLRKGIAAEAAERGETN